VSEDRQSRSFHPIAVGVPLVSWTASLGFDLLSHYGADDNGFARASERAMIFGLAGALVSGAFGLRDVVRYSPAKPAGRPLAGLPRAAQSWSRRLLCAGGSAPGCGRNRRPPRRRSGFGCALPGRPTDARRCASECGCACNSRGVRVRRRPGGAAFQRAAGSRAARLTSSIAKRSSLVHGRRHGILERSRRARHPTSGAFYEG